LEYEKKVNKSIKEPVKIISDHPEIIFDKISFGFEHYKIYVPIKK